MASRTPILLLTRFSWPHPVWKCRTQAEYQAWIEARLALLRQYPARSIRNAYQKPDMWLILVQDHEADVNAALQAAASSAGVPYAVVRYTGKDIQNTVSDYLLASPIAGATRVCTMRLDSDDLVAADYFARIRTVLDKELGETQDLYLSFPGGCTYDAVAGKFFYCSYPGNPFVGLVESPRSDGGVDTVFRAMHHELLDTVSRAVHLRSDCPMWSSVVHGGNVANQSLLQAMPTELGGTDGLLRRFGLPSSPADKKSGQTAA